MEAVVPAKFEGVALGERLNPFQDLYVSETIAPQDFVSLFSPFLVQHTGSIFQRGNVVVKGVQGSGKSMLLSLLKPEIRVAYAKADKEFPVSGPSGDFVGAGINLVRNSVSDFSQRSFGTESHREVREVALYFGDFLNYVVVADLVESVKKLGAAAEEYGLDLEVASNRGALDLFAAELARDEVWFGALPDVRTLDELRSRLRKRIQLYREYLQFNLVDVPPELVRTKSKIGMPIASASKALRNCGVLGSETKVFVRIDQYEQIGRLAKEKGRAGDIEVSIRQLINKALAARDPYLAFRIGVRRHAWQNDLTVFGEGSELEVDRNYSVVDLDAVLRRKENRKSWIFPSFADDVFRRRLRFVGVKTPRGRERLSRTVLGPSPSASSEAVRYATGNAETWLDCSDDWPSDWKALILRLAKESPLSAKLGVAWLEQQAGARLRRPAPNTVERSELPWESAKRDWWRQERNHLAVLQIAARTRQRLNWAGEDDVLLLSGGNALIFVSLCREIWEEWGKYEPPKDRQSDAIPQVPHAAQEVGIRNASDLWFSKIREQPDGHSHQRFVEVVGRDLKRGLLGDRAMSNPGHNGFSVAVGDLLGFPRVDRFLGEAVDYGHLFDAPHTTKEKDRRERRKWYLSPILCPHFQIPAKHKKEPRYTTASRVWEWMSIARVRQQSVDVGRERPLGEPSANRGHSSQLDLFSD